jgi:hypothetical protein
MKKTYLLTALLAAAGVLAAPHIRASEGHAHGAAEKKPAATSTETVTVTGEVLDMACYIDHGATGEKHASCAKTCIESGLPVGIKTADGKVYLVIGEHKPINKQLAQYAAKTITVKGKLVTRDGISMLANVEIVK